MSYFSRLTRGFAATLISRAFFVPSANFLVAPALIDGSQPAATRVLAAPTLISRTLIGGSQPAATKVLAAPTLISCNQPAASEKT